MTQAPVSPVVLVILDGWGYREETDGNALAASRTPVMDSLWAAYPSTLIRTSGKDVGLPEGQMGNSEVGHLNIGAGRVVMQDLPRIDEAVSNGSLGKNPVLNRLIEAGVPTLMHAITDGRDTPPRSSPEYIERLIAAMPRTVAIATVSGRYYA